MREFLFRGKRKVDGEWVVGDSILRFRDGGTFIVHGGKASVKDMELRALMDSVFMGVLPETIGQYTGLTDKNGTKIFEGDIVKATVIQNLWSKTRKYTAIFVVEYHEKYCYFYLKRERNNLLFDGNWSYGVFIDEVIGNIHDDPELMEGGPTDV